MELFLQKKEFDFISQQNKEFIIKFNEEMSKLGYTSNNAISDGYCWGKYMIIYTKANVKSKKSYARIYIRDEDIVLRLYLSNIDKYREVIEQTPPFIQEVFIESFPTCEHCKGRKECTHQKHYTINEVQYEICDGKAFWFFNPSKEQLEEYIKLFTIFYPIKKI